MEAYPTTAEEKIQTAIKFLSRPVSQLSENDLTAVRMYLEGVVKEKKSRYRLFANYAGKNEKVIVADIERDPSDVDLIDTRNADMFEEYSLFTQSEIDTLKKNVDYIDWDNIVCVLQVEEELGDVDY
ncbi:hypothetical protein [Ligilactobacillus sp. 110_WCHN]|uniref:hypothetical protein n=1 Tax=Ligilactobacillus sp. 110_WCHN TaxID=3057125 RepID=UPI0026733843|nr:hypothetical protein [Ligilactobacillus sp. 110_WCHN]MDO3393906.1 hypothetical protein [Ligilactobacillus sp. 110_WCHN]